VSWLQFQNLFSGVERLGILGFGREGQSTYHAIRKVLPNLSILVFDQKEPNPEVLHLLDNDVFTALHTGDNYLSTLEKCQMVVKAPGVPLKDLQSIACNLNLVSQTELFLNLYRNQVVGITGTKGKSTTTNLLFHILQKAGKSVKLVGNIGIPPLDLVGQIRDEDIIVFEMSSHQLEHSKVSPHIAVLLNIFEEHLDHYISYKHYQLAKMNIAKNQREEDVFVCYPTNAQISQLLHENLPKAELWSIGNSNSFENNVYCLGEDLIIKQRGKSFEINGGCNATSLLGEHNKLNICAAVAVAHKLNLDHQEILNGLRTFQGLPHRLEFVGTRKEIMFYNDSISTIPESTIAAIKALPATSTIILGGYDRGVNFSLLLEFLRDSTVTNLVFVGAAGRRMYEEGLFANGTIDKICVLCSTFTEAFHQAVRLTPANSICLLSPAASSYDEFKNFEHRGEFFKSLVNKL